MSSRQIWPFLGAILFVGAAALAAEANKGDAVDWDRARQLMQKFRNGQELTAEERDYLERAKQAKGKGGPNAPGPKAPPATDHTGLVPLDQMTAEEKYKGEDGGLYGGGKNVPPPHLQKLADKALAQIAPLGADGRPASDGKIVLLSIGMSNTTQEFSKFKELADADAAKSPAVAIVDGAQGGQDAARWSEATMPAWSSAEQRLKAAGVSANQVQVLWMKHARIGPARYGEFPKHVEELKGHVAASLRIAREKFPNLRVVYLSSRIYAGYAVTPLNPEPYAYESAFAVRGLILDQMKGDVKAPVLLWGPYLWGDGTTARKSDGLVWTREDLGGDGTHPSASGREKVARLLLTFLKTDPNAKGWFRRSQP